MQNRIQEIQIEWEDDNKASYLEELMQICQITKDYSVFESAYNLIGDMGFLEELSQVEGYWFNKLSNIMINEECQIHEYREMFQVLQNRIFAIQVNPPEIKSEEWKEWMKLYGLAGQLGMNIDYDPYINQLSYLFTAGNTGEQTSVIKEIEALYHHTHQSRAGYLLAHFYYEGTNVGKNLAQASKILGTIDTDFYPATFLKNYINYQMGTINQSEFKKGIQTAFSRAAEEEDDYAILDFSNKLVEIQEFQIPFEWLTKSNRLGCHVQIPYVLGCFHLDSIGFHDLDKAFECFQKAAKEGHVEAQQELNRFKRNLFGKLKYS